MLKLNNLEKSFGRKKLFSNLSYEFADTGLYRIDGKSGVGKTTLLRLICGLDKNYSGEIISDKPHNFSFLFQEHRLFPNLTLFENIRCVFDNSDNDEEIRNMLIELGFNEKDFSLYPSELSGGMKQRCAIARALLFDSSVLLIDEPTKELDEFFKNKVYALIKEKSKNRLCILVSHDDLSDFNFDGVIQL